MEKTINIWEDEEVKTLFKFVEIKKSEGLPLIKIFKLFADFVGRKQNSVRNYYYKEIKNLVADNNRCKNLNISLSDHTAKNAIPFSENETKNVIESVKQMVNNGFSVRKACLTLANGDATKMIRYQNKYRSSIKSKNIKSTENSNGNIIDTIQHSNVITMQPKQTTMSDDDIKALFMGILKLVKKQEMEKASKTMQDKLIDANTKLKRAVAEIIIEKNKKSQ